MLSLVMIERITASIGLYIFSKTMNTRTLSRPKHFHKKISIFINRNKEILLDAGKDEIIEWLFNDNIININPSLSIIKYVLLLIISLCIYIYEISRNNIFKYWFS